MDSRGMTETRAPAPVRTFVSNGNARPLARFFSQNYGARIDRVPLLPAYNDAHCADLFFMRHTRTYTNARARAHTHTCTGKGGRDTGVAGCGPPDADGHA